VPELKVKEIPQTEARPKVAELLRLPQANSPIEVMAGEHSIRYDHQSEIRFGPPLYKVTVTGRLGGTLSERVGKFPVFAPKLPYQSALGWYAFVEWRGDMNGRGSSAIKTVDLARGVILSTMDLADFAGWRGGRSGEFVAQEYAANRSSNWFACDARTGKRRPLFQGGYEGHVSGDGRYLLVLHTRVEVFVALISIDSAEVIDLKKASDFKRYAPTATLRP